MPTSRVTAIRRPVLRAGRRIAALAAVAALLLVPAGAGSAAAGDLDLVVDRGPVQIFDASVDETGGPHLDVGVDGAAAAPERTLIRIDGDAARAHAHTLPAARIGGVAPDDDVFWVPAAPGPDLPALGWSTRRIAPPGDGGGATLSLQVEVAGPGEAVALGTAGDGSLVPLIDSRDEGGSRLDLPTGHFGDLAWLFTAPGRYSLDVTPTLGDEDGTLAGAQVRYRIEVTEPTPEPQPEPQPEPGPEVEAPAAVDPVVPDAVVSPEPAPGETPGPTAAPRADAADACVVPGLDVDAEAVGEGHFDYGVQVIEGRLRSLVKDDRAQPPVWRAPSSLIFEVSGAAERAVPTNPEYAFLGAPGDPIWTIGQVQESGIPWLGWNTQHTSAIAEIAGATRWTLDEVEGPGDLFLYQSGSLGGVTRLLGSADGWPRSLDIAPNTHVHSNWTFTEPGVYQVTTTHRATLRSGAVVTNTDVLHLHVGEACPEGVRGTGAASPPPIVDPPARDDEGEDEAPEEEVDESDEQSDSAGRPAPPVTPAPTPVRCVPAPTAPGGAGPTGSGSGASGTGGNGGTAPGPDAAPSSAQTVSDGHFDFGPTIEGGSLVARVKDDRTQPPRWVSPGSLRFAIGGAARQQVPAGAAYSFLGSPGDPIWLIPQTQVSGVPWLGWNTQHESVRTGVAGSVRFTLNRVEGPGQLAVYLTDSFGGVGQRVFGSMAGFSRGFDVPLNVHTHGNWAFTAPGSYRVTLTISARLTTGQQVSDTATLAFQVGGGDGRSAAPSAHVRPGVGARVVPMTSSYGTVARAADEPAADEPAADEAGADEAGADEAGADEAGETPAVSGSAAADCVLPATGSDGLASVLLPIGTALVLGGALLVLGGRRQPRSGARDGCATT